MQPTLSQTSSQTEANRANAQLSTGPKTDTGKARARLNATRHGLTGQVMILSTEELAAYKRHCEPDGPGDPLQSRNVGSRLREEQGGL